MKREEAISFSIAGMFIVFAIVLVGVFVPMFTVLSLAPTFLLTIFIAVFFLWFIVYRKNSGFILKINKNMAVAISFMGRELVILKDGWYFSLIYLGLDKLERVYDLSDQMIKLELVEGKLGDVDISDGSIGVIVSFYYHIVCPEKTFLKTRNENRLVSEKVEAAIRSYLGQYDLEGIIEHKSHFNISLICSNIKAEKNQKNFTKSTISDTEIYVEMMSYGIEPLSVAVLDIIMSESVKKQRAQEFEAKELLSAETVKVDISKKLAEQEIVKAEAEAKKKELLAGADAKAIEARGAAEARVSEKRIAVLSKASDSTLGYMASVSKYENLSKSGASIFINESSDSNKNTLPFQAATISQIVKDQDKNQDKKKGDKEDGNRTQKR